MVKFVPWGRSFQRFPNSENPFSTLFDSYGGIVEILVIVVVQPDTGPLLWSPAKPNYILNRFSRRCLFKIGIITGSLFEIMVLKTYF